MIGDNAAGSAMFNVAEVLLLLVALYNINVDEMVGERERLLTQSRRRRRLDCWCRPPPCKGWAKMPWCSS